MNKDIIDLRSDTVTTPCQGMRSAMANAAVGDDVYEDDNTVKELESRLAKMAGHESGLFFPSGTQSNLVALLCHCERGQEFIVGQEAHTYKYEGGGAAVLGSIQPQPVEVSQNGTMCLQKIQSSIKADDIHFARTRLLALENTTGGKIIPQQYIADARKLARQHGLKFHLDGARVFNAAVAQDLALDAITEQFDSVSICLSKGLRAPVGSVLVANQALISEAKRWRKMVGGGMRQVGILAAAGLYALDHHIDQLADDHRRAQLLAKCLATIDGLTVIDNQAHTNMIYISTPNHSIEDFHARCARENLKLGGRGHTRLVVHADVNDDQIEQAAIIIRRCLADPQ